MNAISETLYHKRREEPTCLYSQNSQKWVQEETFTMNLPIRAQDIPVDNNMQGMRSCESSTVPKAFAIQAPDLCNTSKHLRRYGWPTSPKQNCFKDKDIQLPNVSEQSEQSLGCIEVILRLSSGVYLLFAVLQQHLCRFMSSNGYFYTMLNSSLAPRHSRLVAWCLRLCSTSKTPLILLYHKIRYQSFIDYIWTFIKAKHNTRGYCQREVSQTCATKHK